MGLFSVTDWGPGNGQREVGSARFRELIHRDFGKFFLANLFTAAGFLPFASGCVYAILSKSVLVLIISGLIGGAIAGPFLSGMTDCIYRSLRDAPGGFFENWKKAMRQNLKASIVPGMILFLLTGVYLFMGVMIFWWASSLPGLGTIAIYLFGMLIMIMFFIVLAADRALLPARPPAAAEHAALHCEIPLEGNRGLPASHGIRRGDASFSSLDADHRSVCRILVHFTGYEFHPV